jgi:hypothetical protein
MVGEPGGRSSPRGYTAAPMSRGPVGNAAGSLLLCAVAVLVHLRRMGDAGGAAPGRHAAIDTARSEPESFARVRSRPSAA